MIRVLIYAPSAVTLAGLESVISNAKDLEVVARHSQLDSALHAAEHLQPDVIVLELGDETEHITNRLSALANSIRSPAIVALTENSESVWTGELLRAGVRAIVPRDVGADAMRAAIVAAATNLIAVHADFAASLLSPSLTARVLEGAVAQLTARERDVLQMMADGLGNKTIARRLGISMHTVKFHVGSIMSKLHAGSRTEAVTLGIRQGLILL